MENTRKIFLIDYIGIHCGMHYYLEAFKEILQNDQTTVKILSNFSDCGGKPFFFNHYNGNILKKSFYLIRNLLRLRRFLRFHKNDIFIYLSYGNIIDIPFMKSVSTVPNHIIDIHEVIAQNIDTNVSLKDLLKNLYNRKIKTVISHSQRTDDFLDEFGVKAYRFHVPHFKYRFEKEFNITCIPDRIQRSIDKERINLLFFGNLNESKGVDILIDAVNKLPDNISDRLNVIIAGKDFDGAVDKIEPLKNKHIHIFKQHISDDELRFLYQNVDYIALPYRKTSQSGILEMAFYFNRPIIASDVEYFRRTLDEFPSFGILSGRDSDAYAKTLEKVIENHKINDFYSDEDYARYENRKEVNLFKEEILDWLSKT